jgi:hypothetical protein
MLLTTHLLAPNSKHPKVGRLPTVNFELVQKFAPRRDKRHATFGSLDEAETWARSLDWRTNDYDFFRLCQGIFDYLDCRNRDDGFRIDQFISRDQLMREARVLTEWFERENFGEIIGVFRFLYSNFSAQIGGQASEALNRRRSIVHGITENPSENAELLKSPLAPAPEATRGRNCASERLQGSDDAHENSHQY